MFGSVYLTTDLSVVEQTLQTRSAKVIIVDEENPYPQAMDMVTMASILLPPYEALSAMVDGEEAIFKQIYFEYLDRPEPASFMAILIAAIYRGINLLLYVPNDESEFLVPLIAKFSMYGVIIGDNMRPFILDPNAEPIRLGLCTYYGMMQVNEYLQRLPEMYPIDMKLLPILIQFYNPHLADYSELSYLQFFEGLRRKIRTNPNVIVPFGRL